MVRHGSAGWLSVLAAAAVGLSACGGPSQEEVRAQQAGFVREADAVCEKAIDRLSSGEQPRSYGALSARANRDAKTLRTANADLHGLREKLENSTSPPIDGFDSNLDAVLAATRRVGDDAGLRDAGATRRSAERLRRAYRALYISAQEAKLRRCGRGGNRAADMALFTVYRDEYVTVNVDVITRLRQRKEAQSFESYRRFLRSGLRVFANYRKRLSRLEPPRALRRSNRLLLQRSTRALESGRRLLALLDRGQAAAIRGGARLAVMRVTRQARLADAAAEAIRRILSSPGGRRVTPAPQGTDSV